MRCKFKLKTRHVLRILTYKPTGHGIVRKKITNMVSRDEIVNISTKNK
jgi:hypothetical protein